MAAIVLEMACITVAEYASTAELDPRLYSSCVAVLEFNKFVTEIKLFGKNK